jgi:hypothetical protein
MKNNFEVLEPVHNLIVIRSPAGGSVGVVADTADLPCLLGVEASETMALLARYLRLFFTAAERLNVPLKLHNVRLRAKPEIPDIPLDKESIGNCAVFATFSMIYLAPQLPRPVFIRTLFHEFAHAWAGADEARAEDIALSFYKEVGRD